MLKESALLTHNTLDINVGIWKAFSAALDADTSVPGAKGRMVNIWAKQGEGTI